MMKICKHIVRGTAKDTLHSCPSSDILRNMRAKPQAETSVICIHNLNVNIEINKDLLSQPVISENVRESRQLNFAECCPCHESQRSADYDVMEAASTRDSCPCQSASDSESAPSIFTPAVRAVEPFTRSGEIKAPNPLLKPEVGLASSVLETLQEVTDQEYQEALVRDATRTALNDREENLLEQEITNTPRNIVNIILQPKDGHTLDDVMPEASHMQETRCVHPPLEYLKNSKQKNNSPSAMKETDKKFEDVSFSPSNLQNHFLRNNERIHYLPKSSKSLSHEEDLIKENLNSKEKYLNDELIETQKDVMPEEASLWNPLSDTNLVKPNNVVTKDNEKNDCEVNLSKENIQRGTKYSVENMDAESSPTELNTNIAEKPINEIGAKDNYLNDDWKDDTFNNKIPTQALIKETVPVNNDVTEMKDNNELMAKDVETDNLENESSDGHSCDAEEAGSSDAIKIAKIPQTKDKKNSVDNVNDIDITESSTLEIPKNYTDENNNNISKNINTQDLQEMSDRILNLSLSNEKSVEPLEPDTTVNINDNTDVIKNIDNEMSPSELFKMEEPSLSSSNSLLKSSDEIADISDTFNEIDKNHNKVNNDAIDVSRKNPCESMTPKISDNTGVSSSNDQEKEMMSQASSPYENRIRHTNQDFIVQPESDINVKDILDNLKSSLSDIFNNNENINSNKGTKSYAQTRTRGDLSNWDKNNHQTNHLNSYKAKVASPDSLNLKTVQSQLNKNRDTLQRPFQDDSEVRSAKDAFRNIKESIDDFKRSHKTNQNNLLGESHTPQNILWTTLRPNNIDKRLQDFHSDLKDRFSQVSQRIPDILPFDDKSNLLAKYKINNLNNPIKSNPKYQVKSNDLPKSKINLALKPHTSQSILGSSKKGLSKSNLQQKINLTPKPLGASLRQFEDPIQLGHKFESKTPLRKEIRRKPLKENKITFSFTTPRPQITKLRPNQKIYNKLTPETLRSLFKLPKSSYKSPLQKSLELKSKFNPDELKHSASNQFTSHIEPDMKLGNPKTAFSSLEESKISPTVSDLCDENTYPKISDLSSKNNPERSENVLMTKMRDAGKAKDMLSGALPDAKPSASNNRNTVTSSFTDRSLKENVSYKCKMICFEDNEDSE
ncbi:uncharacterized protein MAL13P1.304-like [Nymphalis io]|uniref:uncharacterized protein MAL13P1.304-like n=1 Tax=Inachis io TaxID=171585 RepID=UPI002169AE71|nr:uncharacterized protein MAL13P1.304-like [Nymphalis io]